MIWTKTQILQELKSLHKSGQDLSYNALARTQQSLVSAAAYHFKSYRKAVEAAGIDYAEVARRPRWTRAGIIAMIKSAHRKGEELHWAAVTRRRDELGKAAFASLQPRLFGQWKKALSAAGLDVGEISRYRRWDRKVICEKLRQRFGRKSAMNSGALQSDDPGLHAAAIRHFGDYDEALRSAKLNPATVRRRRRWSKSEVLDAIKGAAKNGNNLSDSKVRREFPALYGAAVRLFGAFTSARSAAKVKFTPKRRGK